VDRDGDIPCKWFEPDTKAAKAEPVPVGIDKSEGPPRLTARYGGQRQAGRECATIVGKCAARIEHADECAEVEWAIWFR
jgi:hypothetical protein